VYKQSANLFDFLLLLLSCICADIKLGQAELERWFTHIDHLIEHTRVPQLGESLTPFYRVKGDGTQKHHLPLVSHVHYK
jgi:hypothetical protein